MKLLSILFIILFSFASLWADSNGIWVDAQDIRVGTFGSDETDVVTPFVFNNPIEVYKQSIFSSNVKTLLVNSTGDDAIHAITSAPGKSAIYGWSQGGTGYSGYFEGGRFVVGSGNVGIGTNNPASILDVRGNILMNSEIVSTQNWSDTTFINVGESGDSILDNTIDSTEIQDLSISTIDLADNSVTSQKILNGTIRSNDIGVGAITTTNIADNSITSIKIIDGAIVTSDLADNSVTSQKIASNSITSDKIVDGTITSADIANGVIGISDLDLTALDSRYERAGGGSTLGKSCDPGHTVTGITGTGDLICTPYACDPGYVPGRTKCENVGTYRYYISGYGGCGAAGMDVYVTRDYVVSTDSVTYSARYKFYADYVWQSSFSTSPASSSSQSFSWSNGRDDPWFEISPNADGTLTFIRGACKGGTSVSRGYLEFDVPASSFR